MKNIRTKQTPCFRRWSRKGWAAFASLHRHVTIGVLAVTMSILLLATQHASAHDADTAAVLKTLRIDEVGISGSQSAPTRSVQSQTPLFDRKAQAAAPVQTLESALRLAPSVDIRERGGKGMQADIFIRGGSFDQTMVLLNGIDFTDARTGHQSHALPVDIDCISAVDLLDGVPGVGAFAGAVNIRTAPLKPTYLRCEGAGGQHGYAYANLSGAVTSGRFSLLAAGSYRRSDGYRHNTDFANYNAFVRATYEAPRAGFFDLQAGYQNRTFGSNGFYAAYNPDQWEATSTALASLRWLKQAGRFSFGASASYRKNFDRYDWTRGTAMNRRQRRCPAVGGLRLAGGYDLARRRLCLQPHLQHQSRRGALPAARPLYARQGAQYGQPLAAPCQTVAAVRPRGFCGHQPHALRHFGAVEPLGRLYARRGAAPRHRGVPVDAPADLHRPLLYFPGTDQQP